MQFRLAFAALSLLPVSSALDYNSCTIKTVNSNWYICPSKLYPTGTSGAPEATDGLTLFSSISSGCAQADADFSNTGTFVSTADFSGGAGSVSCADVDPTFVINCFMYASIGKTAGSCGEVSSDADACLFADSGEVNFLPDSLAAQCVGLASCTVGAGSAGWTADDETIVAGQTDKTADGSGYTWSEVAKNMAKLKLLVVCGPAADSVSAPEDVGGADRLAVGLTGVLMAGIAAVLIQ